jgi:hypothetical protein
VDRSSTPEEVPVFGLPVHCQRCDRRLTAADDAAACRHGCTFCPRCADELGSVCPNCSGELVRRPAAA